MMEAALKVINSIVTKGKESPAQSVAILSILLATGCSAYYMFSSSSDKNHTIAPAMTEEEAEKAMVNILIQLRGNVPRFLQAANSIKQQIEAQGQQIEEAQLLKMFILPHLEAQLQQIQEAILTTIDYDDDEFEEAVDYYIAKGNAKIDTCKKDIRKIFKEFGKEIETDDDEEVAEVMTLDKAVALIQELADLVVVRTNELAKKATKDGKQLLDESGVQTFQYDLVLLTDSVEKEVIARNGITVTEFHKAVEKYKHSEQIQEIFTDMQRRNYLTFSKFNIHMG